VLIGLDVAMVLGAVSAHMIVSPDDLLSGTFVDGRIGDFVLQNDLVTVVISAIGHDQLYAISGGNIIDAGSSTRRIDALGNLYTYFNDDWPRQADYSSLIVINDGSGGGPAVIRASGVDSYNPSLTVTTDYSLTDGALYLTISTTVTNTGSGTYADFELGDGIHWGDCQKFAPGFGFSLPSMTTEPWIAGTSAHISYGYASPPVELWGSNGSQWSDLNVTTVSLGPGESGSYSRHFVVGGEDIASVVTLIHEIAETPVGFVRCTVTSDSNGEPLSDATIDAHDGLNTIYLQMETDQYGLASVTLPPGDWRLYASAFGHESEQTWLSVVEGENTFHDFSLMSDGTEILAVGDTLTLIQRPLLNIPALVVPGDTLAIECEADQLTLEWTAELRRGETGIPLEICSATYDPGTLWWTLCAVVPEVQLFETYDLKVTANGRIEDTTRNAVKILPEFKDDYYFVHITDTHLPTTLYHYESGAETDTSEIVDLREVIADLNIINPEFVVLTGDLVHEGELEDYLYRRYYTKAQRMLTEFQTPVFLTAGNHDIGGWPDTPPSAGIARRTWWKFFGWKRLNAPPPDALWHTQNYSFDYGPTHYIALEAYDNYDMWRYDIYGDESFTDPQLPWLDENLAAASTSATQVLFYHYDFSDQVNLAQLGIEMTLWGHIHYDQGSIYSPPYDLATNNVCDGDRSFRLIRVSNGILAPSPTLSAGSTGSRLNVQYSPANDGTNSYVTAEITNNFNERFEHAQLLIRLPRPTGSIGVTGGTLVQVDDSDSIAVCYVEVDILPYSVQTVTVNQGALAGELTDGELTLTWPEWPGAAAYWVYGASNGAYFEPGIIPPYEHRLEVLQSSANSWSSARGIGDPDNNWTYVIMPVDWSGTELVRLGPWSESDFAIVGGFEHNSYQARQ